MITIAHGLFQHTLDWTYILIGIGAGVAAIIVDRLLAKFTSYSLPPLAIAMGIYLPPSVATALFLGALISWIVKKRIRSTAASTGADSKPMLEQAERKGTLFASGLIVGESLVGVVLAMLIVASVGAGGSDAPLALVGADFAAVAKWIGLVALVGMCVLFGRRALR